MGNCFHVVSNTSQGLKIIKQEKKKKEERNIPIISLYSLPQAFSSRGISPEGSFATSRKIQVLKIQGNRKQRPCPHLGHGFKKVGKQNKLILPTPGLTSSRTGSLGPGGGAGPGVRRGHRGHLRATFHSFRPASAPRRGREPSGGWERPLRPRRREGKRPRSYHRRKGPSARCGGPGSRGRCRQTLEERRVPEPPRGPPRAPAPPPPAPASPQLRHRPQRPPPRGLPARRAPSLPRAAAASAAGRLRQPCPAAGRPERARRAAGSRLSALRRTWW